MPASRFVFNEVQGYFVLSFLIKKSKLEFNEENS